METTMVATVMEAVDLVHEAPKVLHYWLITPILFYPPKINQFLFGIQNEIVNLDFFLLLFFFKSDITNAPPTFENEPKKM